MLETFSVFIDTAFFIDKIYVLLRCIMYNIMNDMLFRYM